MRKIQNTIIIGILLAVCEFAGGQELEFRGSGLWSSAYTVFADSEYVYCGYQNGLLILRISEPPGLEFVSRLFISDWGRAAAAYGDYAFFIDWELGLQSIDISNIEHPVTAQLIDSLEVPISLFIRNNYAYVGGDRGEFYIVDIQSPENMVVLSSTDISSRNIYTVCANDQNAFLGLSYDLYVIDISDPISPVVVGDLNAQYDFGAITIDDNYAYVCVLSSGMLIIDISDPANPEIISICDTPGYSQDVAVSGNYAYVADDYLGLQVINISDPLNPDIVGDYDIPGVAVDIFYREGYVYLADDYLGIYMIDVTDPSNPLLVDQFKSHYYLHDLKVSGNYAYAGTKGLGFAIADVSDITDPLLVSNWVIYLEHAFNVAVESPYAYVVFSDCMRIFDISDPYNPMVTGVAAWGGSSGDLVYSDDYLYAALGRYFALCYVHDRTNPLPRGWLYFDDTIHNLDVRENLAYVAGGSGGFFIISTFDKWHPQVVGSFSTPDSCMDVRLIYPTAYVAHKSGLKILDVTNPEAPVLLGSYEFGDRYVHSIDLIDHYAFLGAREGIRILDVADPANPLLVEEHPMAGYGNVLVDGDNVYFYTHYSFQISEFGYSTDIEGGSGLSQIHFTLDNYPNPFNNETTIRYFLPSAGNVRIEIYDILGRKIETLSRGMCEAGSHSVIWNPKDAASGIYFYSIDVENFSRTNSCILLK